jgi:hypothetical protein
MGERSRDGTAADDLIHSPEVALPATFNMVCQQKIVTTFRGRADTCKSGFPRLRKSFDTPKLHQAPQCMYVTQRAAGTPSPRSFCTAASSA